MPFFRALPIILPASSSPALILLLYEVAATTGIASSSARRRDSLKKLFLRKEGKGEFGAGGFGHGRNEETGRLCCCRTCGSV